LLRICLGRAKRLCLFGPPGFTESVDHKLAAYTWNLVAENETDFVVSAMEFDGQRITRGAEFHTRDSFRRRDAALPTTQGEVLLDDDEFRVRGALLDHRTPSLAFAFEEKLRVNVWKDQLDRLGLPVGAWLTSAKQAVRRGDPDDTSIAVSWEVDGSPREKRISLGELKADVLQLGPGQKIVYVTDAAYHAVNAARIIELAHDADDIFIEAAFLEKDAAIAAGKRHLTAAQAGTLGRRAGAKRLVPFHFSPRYLAQGDCLRREAEDAFAGNVEHS
jgi:ribonuclease Z